MLSAAKITSTPPVFQHPEINDLYQHGVQIPPEKLKAILALPRETFIADLEKVVGDARDRYLFFLQSGWGEKINFFPVHAICLLGELQAENSLSAILQLLESDKKMLDFWFGDHLTETLWQPVYQLSQNNTGLLKAFLLKPELHTYAKVVATEALVQIALNQPSKRDEIAGIYNEVLSWYNQPELNEAVIDREFIGLTIGDLIDCNFIELLPLVKELYDKKRVSLTVNGTYMEVVEFFQKPSGIHHKRTVTGIVELYENILTTWASYAEGDNDFSGFDDELSQPRTSVKIGRNEPCPCGSGKKYKKCCLDKLPG